MKYTVLTPTYNRQHTLSRVFESLQVQTLRDFEWIIVDDGSTDDTGSLVKSWKTFFPIRYVWKPNGGKHSAINVGVSMARGEFLVIFDSDDACTPNALERFHYHWQLIPDLSRFATLGCLCRTPEGSIVGEPFPAACIDAFTLADQVRYSKWERWRMDRTEVLRKFPFPEGELFVPESLIWNRISKEYAQRFFNEALRIYEPQPDSLSHKGFALRAASPRATLTLYRELALASVPVSFRIRAAFNFVRFAAIAALPWFFSRLFSLEWRGGRGQNRRKT
jgi:glycosyltransferase involved in cell wall biosynthesis